MYPGAYVTATFHVQNKIQYLLRNIPRWISSGSPAYRFSDRLRPIRNARQIV